MKRIRLALLGTFIISLISCSDSNNDNTNHYLQKMTGRYRLSEIYTDEAVDLNYDGVSNTDLFIEMDCMDPWPFSFYTAEIQNLSNTYNPLSYNVPVINIPQTYPTPQCYGTGSMFYNLDVDKNSGSISIVDGDLTDEETELERGKLEAVTYNNDTIQ